MYEPGQDSDTATLQSELWAEHTIPDALDFWTTSDFDDVLESYDSAVSDEF